MVKAEVTKESEERTNIEIEIGGDANEICADVAAIMYRAIYLMITDDDNPTAPKHVDEALSYITMMALGGLKLLCDDCEFDKPSSLANFIGGLTQLGPRYFNDISANEVASMKRFLGVDEKEKEDETADA